MAFALDLTHLWAKEGGKTVRRPSRHRDGFEGYFTPSRSHLEYTGGMRVCTRHPALPVHLGVYLLSMPLKALGLDGRGVTTFAFGIYHHPAYGAT